MQSVDIRRESKPESIAGDKKGKKKERLGTTVYNSTIHKPLFPEGHNILVHKIKCLLV